MLVKSNPNDNGEIHLAVDHRNFLGEIHYDVLSVDHTQHVAVVNKSLGCSSRCQHPFLNTCQQNK